MKSVNSSIQKTVPAMLVFVLALSSNSFAQQPSFSELIDCSGEAAATPLCRDQTKAADLRGKYSLLFDELKVIVEPPWDPAEFSKAIALSDEAQGLTNDEYFGDAVPRLEEALKILNQLKATLEQAVESEMELANTLMEAKRFDEARRVYEKIHGWRPGRGDIGENLTQIDEIQRLNSLLNDVARKIDDGETDSALADLQGVPQASRDTKWHDLLERIEAPRREARFQYQVTSGIEQRDRGNLQEARKSFSAALKIKPNSELVRELYEDVEIRIANANIEDFQERTRLALEAEEWIESAMLLVQLVKLVDDAIVVETQLALVQERIKLESTADHLLKYKESGLSKSRRGEIRDFLSVVADIDTGTRISSKADALRLLLDEWSTPILVTLTSDNKTEVRVRPGRSLGKFDTRKVEMLPGSYRISGIRRGYHEVVHEIDLKPQQNPITLKVECRERF